MDKEYALNIVKVYKKAISDRLSDAKVYLYGSYSKGCANEDSDIDVAVVIPKINEDWLDLSSFLWKTSWKINTLIEPVLLEENEPSPLYDDVIRTGIRI